MKESFFNFFRCLSLLALPFMLQAGSESVPSKPALVRLSGNIPTKAIDNSILLKSLDATTDLPLTFILPLRNQNELEELVQKIYDPEDQEHYGKYLSSEEFISRFSPTQEDYDKVIAYAKTLGLVVKNTHANRTLLNVSGSVGSIESAFKLSLQLYQTPKGRKFFAANNTPEVPETIASLITGVEGLDNEAVWRSFHHKKEVAEATSHAFPSGPNGGFSPSDLLIAYNLTGVQANGSGQSIALFELGGYQVSDINEYTNHFGLPAAKLHNVLVDGGSQAGINPEVTLDIQVALALAPESDIYVYEGPNSNQGVLDTYNRIATDNLSKQVSTSWGLGEDLVSAQYLQAENAIFLQMAAHGQTIYAAAGDSGAYDDSNSTSPVVDDPASQPYVVGVGGTSLKVNPQTGAYEGESCWNNGAGQGAGGGGVSTVWPIPSWQTNVSTTYSKTHRNVPDVALNADPSTGYAIYYDGSWTIYGGTSCAAPLWAAFTARVNQARSANQKQPLGFANPSLYAIATSLAYAEDFHDVTVGNNLFYPAKTNYDNATGWGSFNGAQLFASLSNSSPTPPPPQESPVLNISLKHDAPFMKKKKGIYHIAVSNKGTSATSGTVTVTIVLPEALTYNSFIGEGWSGSGSTLTFRTNNILDAGASYPPITLKVNVGRKPQPSVVTTATVSGGGSESSTVTDPTSIQ